MIRANRIRRALGRFAADETGASPTIEMAVIIVPLLLVVTSVFEIGVSYFNLVSAQKAVEMGVRAAVLEPAVHRSVPNYNLVDLTHGSTGDDCFQPDGSAACVDPGGPWTCQMDQPGGLCDGTVGARILDQMRRVYPSLSPGDVSITYRNQNLGYAGGPFVPQVEVTIGQRPSPYRILSYLPDFEIREVSSSGIGETMLR